ncbi:MAG: hypothetical protein J6C33_02835 [Lachnospiraceae bacterium]|nr:hypothetical protein [Lachnospiraceae bacterium]
MIYSSNQMFSTERKEKPKGIKALTDIPMYSIPYTQIRKIAALKNYIWGL